MEIVAIIPAGGAGKRFGGDLSKQYLVLNGTYMLVHTLAVFQQMKSIDRMILLVPEKDIGFVKSTILAGYGLSKVATVLAGGKERQDSVKNGLDALGQTLDVDDIVIIHDAVRPMVSEELIDKTIDECRIHDAATLGVPVKDTLKAVSKDGWIYETPDRKHFWLSQTPQAFKKGIIFEAYKRAYEENFYGTDDAALVERIGISVRMVFGSYKNIKITTPEDIVFAEYLLKRRYKEKFMLKAEE